MIYIILDNNYARLEGELSAYAKEKISDTLSFVKKGCEHIESFQKETWDGVVRLFNPGEPFLTGLVAPVVKILQDIDCPFSIVDRRPITKNNFPELTFTKPSWYEDREYQDFAITRSIEITRGILNVGTGGGKTMMVAELIGRLKVKPFMFYVLTRDLLYQAKTTLEACLNCKIGQIGDGVVDIQDVNVCTKDAVIYALNHNNNSFNIQKYKFDSCDVWDESEIFGDSDSEKIVNTVKNARGIFIDECHHASSQTVKDLILASPLAYWRYGGTATMEREDGEEIVIQGLFGRRIVNISASYLIKHGWLVPTGVFFVPVEFRNMEFTSYAEIYKNCVSENDNVNTFVADFSQHLARLGKSSLILVSKITHGKQLKAKIPEAVFLSGKDTSKKRNKVMDEMRTGKRKILIATTLADEGLDIPCLDIVHMIGAGASVTRVPQRIGRAMRRSKSTGKKYGMAIYYHFCTKYLYDQGLKAKRIVRQETALDIFQTADLHELRIKVLEYMTKKESMFVE
jgi:superfamily II DNA or RNA helicase